MAPGDEYRVGGGKLKLKGSKVTDGRIEKKKKKKSKEKKAAEEQDQDQSTSAEREHESEQTPKHEGEESGLVRREGGEREGSDGQRERDSGDEGTVVVGKTEAERKYEEQRKRRLQDRLKREGVKTHKERVEELNKYLSRLTEHHDMPKIGPG
ncbi:hypothetical protein PHISCL_07134 [Aspergillus sclerotialis]|uniref:DUF1754-domain-containing protein n=1 Tax=Aspergillus sclerotialis TaxID=2070753 RepID=A0A3A2ZU65_9EURO|nr:hypothetical protein PHISCL_07134 [Aspergillus sclerotialis]